MLLMSLIYNLVFDVLMMKKIRHPKHIGEIDLNWSIKKYEP